MSFALALRGRRPRATLGSVAAAALAAAVLLGLSAVDPAPFVYRGTELSAVGTVLGVVAGVAAARVGASLAGAVALAAVPTAVVTLLTTGGVLSPTVAGDALVALGTVIYVAGGVAIPAGMLAYAVGVRSRTGAWASLEEHLSWNPRAGAVLVGWTLLATVVAAGSVLVPGVISQGVVQFGLLVGALAAATVGGSRALGVGTAVGCGVVGASFVAVAWTLGVVPGPAERLAMTASFAVGFGLVVGVPVGLLGYTVGRALRADAA